MNPLLYTLKSPDIRGYYRSLDHAQQGAPETLTFRDVIMSKVWLMKRLRFLYGVKSFVDRRKKCHFT